MVYRIGKKSRKQQTGDLFCFPLLFTEKKKNECAARERPQTLRSKECTRKVGEHRNEGVIRYPVPGACLARRTVGLLK